MIRTPFKSLPAMQNEKNRLVRAGSEGSAIPKVVDLSPVVCLKFKRDIILIAVFFFFWRKCMFNVKCS